MKPEKKILRALKNPTSANRKIDWSCLCGTPFLDKPIRPKPTTQK